MTTAKQIKLFIGCLPSDTIPEEISGYFSKYCTEVDSLEIKIRKNGVCSGFGHLGCKVTSLQLQKVTSETHMYRGRTLEVRQYLTVEELHQVAENLRQRKIHVSNLPEGTKDEDLRELFQKFGEIERAYLANKNPKKNEIYGFVVFKTHKSIQSALKAHLTFRGAKVCINTSTPKVKPVEEAPKKSNYLPKNQKQVDTRSSSFESLDFNANTNKNFITAALFAMQANIQRYNLENEYLNFPAQVQRQEVQKKEIGMPLLPVKNRDILELEYNISPCKEYGKEAKFSSTKMSKVLKLSRDIALNHVSWNVRPAPRLIFN